MQNMMEIVKEGLKREAIKQKEAELDDWFFML